MSTTTHALAYRAYTVIKREGQEDFWQLLGAAFLHQDGEGMNVVLNALPIDGKIVLRVFKDEQPAETGPHVVAGTAASAQLKPSRRSR
ncbi:MAG TPA: hypothetical protein VFB45_04595 [Pseudolabrys sp.]|nr:hypothetical protein [Pseudolabrys sp.]